MLYSSEPKADLIGTDPRLEGALIMIFGAALLLGSPMLIVELLGFVFLIVGVVVVIKGFLNSSEIPEPTILLFFNVPGKPDTTGWNPITGKSTCCNVYQKRIQYR